MNYVNLKIDKKKKTKKSNLSKYIIIALMTFAFTGGGIALAKKSKEWFNPISIVATISSANLKESDGRTNVLVLGSDKRTVGSITSELTDTILIASIGRVEHDVVLISLPRDLWVEDKRGAKSKINAIYTINKQDESDEITGGESIMDATENVLGIPIHYYIVLNFELFKQAIDTLGGVEINVDKSFVDYYYPIEGKENAPISERYEALKFEAGVQTMNGETALKYVRSRQGTNGEDTDFARSERQQKVIAAVKDKSLSLNTLVNPKKIKDLYDLYVNNIDTNISFSDIQNFYLLSQQISFDKIISIVLDDRSAADEGGLLYAPEDRSLYGVGDPYVLLPKTGNFSQMHAYVQRYLFSK